jgi:hypothetical protein
MRGNHAPNGAGLVFSEQPPCPPAGRAERDRRKISAELGSPRKGGTCARRGLRDYYTRYRSLGPSEGRAKPRGGRARAG